MAHTVQAHAYQALPRRDSDSHLPAGQSASAEESIQIPLELGQDSSIPQKSPGSALGSLPATDGSSTVTATAAAAAGTSGSVWISEYNLQRAWRLVDLTAAFFLCMSIAFIVIRRTAAAAVCGCIGTAAAIAYLPWRMLRSKGNSAEALRTAMDALVFAQLLTTLVGIISGGFRLVKCHDAQPACVPQLVYLVNFVYYFSIILSWGPMTDTQLELFRPPPLPEPSVRRYESEQELRERIQVYVPLSAQAQRAAQRARQIQDATQRLTAEERVALYAFRDAADPLVRDEAYRQYQEVAEKLKLLKEDPEQYMQRHGPPSMTV